MPVYHFIFHAYRTWNADHPEGYYQHGEAGRHAPEPRMGVYRNGIAQQAPMEFSTDQQQTLLKFFREICTKRSWRAHAAGMNLTHIHLVVSWTNESDPDKVKNRLKNLLALLLNRNDDRVGRRVFAKKAGDRRVRGMRHLNFLKNSYLRNQGGLYWWEPERSGDGRSV